MLGLTASSVLLAAYNASGSWDSELNNDGTYKKLNDEGTNALILSLSQEDANYLAFLSRLADDVIKDPVIARQLANAPAELVAKYGYTGTINLDEDMLKLILALGDDDINTAVNQNDMNTALALMESKGLLSDIGDNTKVHLTTNQKLAIAKQLGIDINESDINNEAAAFWAVYAIAVLVSVAAVVYTAAATINAAATVTVLLWAEVLGQSNDVNGVIDKNLPLKLWSLKGDAESTYIATDKYINSQAKRIVDIAKAHNSSLLQYVSEQELSRLVKLNIIQNMK